MKVLKLACVNDALLSVPIWETTRPKNWLAIINVDGTKPGGLSRKWVPRARGDLYYMIENVGVFDALEFAADRVALSGKILTNRWYGVVIEKTATHLSLEKVDSGAKAVLYSHKYKAGVPQPVAKPSPPPPPSEEQLQMWADAFMKPPKQKRAKECLYEYLEAMAARDYVKASQALSRSLTYKLQSPECMKAIDEASNLIRNSI